MTSDRFSPDTPPHRPFRMRFQRLVFAAGVLLMLSAAACESVTGPDDNKPPDGLNVDSTGNSAVPGAGMKVVGYHPWWLASSWSTYDFSLLDRIYFFELKVGADGRLSDRSGWPFLWTAMTDVAIANDVAVSPTVTILDTDTYVSVFSDTLAIRSLEDEIVSLSSSGRVAGLHLDIEVFDPVPSGLRDSFSIFVESVSRRVHQNRPDFSLSIFMLALDKADNYDERRLAAAVDFVVVQGYDFHWIGDEEAGPVASLSGWSGRNWQDVVDRLITAGVPRSKMFMAVPYYGYEWPTTGPEPGARTRGFGSLVPYAPVLDGFESARERASRFGKLRDQESGSPYYAFQDSSGWNQGWFEDAESLAAKYNFVLDQQLAGIAIFPFGYGDAELNEVLRTARQGFPRVPVPGTN
jgi:Glycosyl hydrolases family 18